MCWLVTFRRLGTIAQLFLGSTPSTRCASRRMMRGCGLTTRSVWVMRLAAILEVSFSPGSASYLITLNLLAGTRNFCSWSLDFYFHAIYIECRVGSCIMVSRSGYRAVIIVAEILAPIMVSESYGYQSSSDNRTLECQRRHPNHRCIIRCILPIRDVDCKRFRHLFCS